METFNYRVFAQLLLISLVSKELSSLQFCIDGEGHMCWYNDFKKRDETCASQGLYCRYSFEAAGIPKMGTCFCCRKSNAYPRSDLPDCPVFSGLVTDISNFDRELEPELISAQLAVDPPTIISQHADNIFSVLFTGVDQKYVYMSDFTWKKRLKSCNIYDKIIIKQKLWEDTWVNETEVWDGLLWNQCNHYDPSETELLIWNLTSPYILERNIKSSPVGDINITADRYYAKHNFSYKIVLNITAKWDTRNEQNEYGNVTAEHLESTLALQTGLTFVKRLDEFTIRAEATAGMESQFPVSTVYKLALKS